MAVNATVAYVVADASTVSISVVAYYAVGPSYMRWSPVDAVTVSDTATVTQPSAGHDPVQVSSSVHIVMSGGSAGTITRDST